MPTPTYAHDPAGLVPDQEIVQAIEARAARFRELFPNASAEICEQSARDLVFYDFGAERAELLSKEPITTMSTSTLERPAPVALAARTNGEPMRALLDDGKKVGYGDRLRSLPRRMRAHFRNTVEALRLSSVGQAIGRGYKSLAGVLGGLYRRVGGATFLLSALGALLTSEKGRRIIRKTVYTVARVVTAPFRFLGRMAAKVLNKFSWGRKVVAKVSETASRISSFLSRKFEAGLAWFDKHEGHWAMQIFRGFFQNLVAMLLIGGKLTNTRTVQGFVPVQYQKAAALAHFVFMPEIGSRYARQSGGRRLYRALRSLYTEVRGGNSTAVGAEAFLAKSTVESGMAYKEDGTSVPVEVIIDGDGDRWIKYDGVLYATNDLPDGVTMEPSAVVKQLADAKSVQAHLEAQVAASNGTAPANRAEKRAAAKAHGPAKK